MKTNCDNCIKSSTCLLKEAIQGFVMEQWPRFERVDELVAEKAWLAFLGDRCKEYQNETDITKSKPEQD